MKSQDCHSPDLNVARGLISALSASIPAVRSLRGRWSAVSATLSRLREAADDLADLPASATSHPLAADLLASLARALSHTLDLSIRCAAAADPPDGKLRTQSDLAAAAAELARLAADADLLLRSGTLLDPSTPAAGRAVGRAHAHARALVTRLQLGSASAQDAALDSLLDFLGGSDKNAVAAAAQGAAPALARLISSPPSQEKALAALARLAGVEGCRQALSAEGPALLARLARVVDAGGASPSAAEHACAALLPLTLTRDQAMVFGSRGSVASLLGLCHAGSPSSQSAAAAVLKNLSFFRDLHESFVEEKAVPTLITVLSSGTVQAQENALSCLCNLAAGEGQSIKLSMLQGGILDCLKNYWEDGGGGEFDRNLEPALGLIKNLASMKYIADAILAAGFAQLIAASVASASLGTRTEAARVVSELALTSRMRKEFVNAYGVVSQLVLMLEAKVAVEKEAALKALAALVQCNDCRRVFQKEEKGVVGLVLLLDPLVKNVDKRYAITVLAALAQSRRCRKQMVAAGACGYLKVLVEVDGSKRLLECLERGKLWGVFPRS